MRGAEIIRCVTSSWHKGAQGTGEVSHTHVHRSSAYLPNRASHWGLLAGGWAPKKVERSPSQGYCTPQVLFQVTGA